jgi:predicted  nucleic acid-binding Zn-ribbon protein
MKATSIKTNNLITHKVMMPKPLKCPACGYAWIYGGDSDMRIGCPKCNKILYGQKIGLCELTLDQYLDIRGTAILDEAREKIDNMVEDVAALEALYDTETNGNVRPS